MSLHKKVGIASLIMMASVFLSRTIGLLREMVIAYAQGAGASVDAYQIAFVMPEILNHMVASGFLSVTFIPIFSSYLAKGKEDEGWKVFSTILTCFGSVLILLIIIFSIFAPYIIDVIAPGISSPDTKKAAIRMTRIIMPAQFFFFSGGLLMAAQFARERFAIPALAPLFYNLGIILFGYFLGPELGMEGFAWGVLAGAFLGNFIIQIAGAKKAGLKFSICFDFKHPDVKKYILLSLPLMFGLTMTFSTEFFLKFFGSFLPEGSIAAINYDLRIMFLLVGFFGQAVGVASFPFMARLAAEKKFDKMQNLLNGALRYLSLIIPFSALFIVLRHEIVLILFQRGKFDAGATGLTAGILGYLMIGTVAFASQTMVMRGYYAMQDTFFPAVYSTAGVILSLPLYWYGMKLMGAKGIALAISLSTIFQVIILYILWNKKIKTGKVSPVFIFYLKIILITIPLGIFLERLRIYLLNSIDVSGFYGAFTMCLITGCVFLLSLPLLGNLLGIKEIKDMTISVRDRLARIF